jgi:AmmeMemoRadiSam system protein A
MDLSAEQGHILLDVARQTVRVTVAGIADGTRVTALESIGLDDPLLQQPAGCFVSLHTLPSHRLRGCVGRLDAREPLIQAVRQAAANVVHDPRFLECPITLDELALLEIEVTVIFPLTPAENCLDFDLLNDGIYLVIGDRAGCFLPQVARETGWTREQLLSRLCTEKLGLSQTAWQEPSARLMKYKTLIIGPEPFEGSIDHASPRIGIAS